MTAKRRQTLDQRIEYRYHKNNQIGFALHIRAELDRLARAVRWLKVPRKLDRSPATLAYNDALDDVLGLITEAKR